MRIEPGYNTDQPIWERGWTYWHHLFNPRQLLVGGLLNQFRCAELKLGFARVLNCNSRLSRFTIGGSGAAMVTGAFDNQALNTLFNYGCRGMRYALDIADADYKSFELNTKITHTIACHSAQSIDVNNEVYRNGPAIRRCRKVTRRYSSSSSPGCARTHRPSSPIGSGTAAARSPSKAKVKIFAAVWWPPTSA